MIELPDDFDSFDLPQLETLREKFVQDKLDNLEEITSIRNQIELAISKVEERSTYHTHDPTWMHRAQTALRHKGRDDQILATHLNTIGRRIKRLRYDQETKRTASRKIAFRDAFIEVARAKLPGETFNQWCAIASNAVEDATGEDHNDNPGA